MVKKRIALIGNMQNWNFALMRWLRDKGYDARLYYQPIGHFKADNDTFKIDSLQYCTEVDWIKKGIPCSEDLVDSIQEEMASFDFIIASGLESAILNFCKIDIDIYIPLGSDFFIEPFNPHEYSILIQLYHWFHPHKKFKNVRYGTIAKYMHCAIKDASNIILESTNDTYESNLYKLNFKGTHHRFNVPFLYHLDAINHFKNQDKPAIHWRDIIDKIRQENNFLVLYHGRQVWKSNDDPTKHTDFLIRGFSEFLKLKENNSSSKLIMLEYGADINASKELINALDISNNVIWLPTMQRKDILYLITKVDLCSGEFGESFLTFGTIVEAMVMGKPVLSYREDSLYSEQYSTLYPLYNAKYPEEITKVLLEVYKNPEQLADTGQKAKEWVIENFFRIPMDKICKIIDESN